MKKIKAGLLFTNESKTQPYQLWLEENIGCNVELINARSEVINEGIELLVLVGGADLNPIRYGQKPSLHTGKPNQDLEWFDLFMLEKYVKRAEEGTLAIWGTCRGFQALNVHFGGSLVQDISQDYSTASRSELVDDLVLLTGHEFSYIGDKGVHITKMKTNSLHHQGFYQTQTAKCFDILGYNKKYNNIEIIKHKTLPVAACQFHPEETYDDYSRQLINRLISRLKQTIVL